MILTHAQLKQWRHDNMPKRCPIFERKIKRPELDHDHKTGHVRGVIEGVANTLIGKIENFARLFLGNWTSLSLPDVLRNVADYIESDEWKNNPLHPSHRKVVRRQFLKFKKAKQEEIIFGLGLDPSDYRNADERADAFTRETLEPYKP